MHTSHNCKLLIPVNLIIHHTDTGFISSAQVSVNLSMLSVNFCSCVFAGNFCSSYQFVLATYFNKSTLHGCDIADILKFLVLCTVFSDQSIVGHFIFRRDQRLKL